MNKFFAFRIIGWKKSLKWFGAFLGIWIVANLIGPMFVEGDYSSYLNGLKNFWYLVVAGVIAHKNNIAGRSNVLKHFIVGAIIAVVVGSMFMVFVYGEDEVSVGIFGTLLLAFYVFVFYNPREV